MAKRYDAIIIGGGIMGCSSAYHLAGRGLKVAVVEKDSIGQGPTGHSSAIIRQHYSNELTARMALHSLRVFQNFEEQLGDECGFQPVGVLFIVQPQDRAGLEANLALQRKVGIRTEMLDAEAIREVMPSLHTADLLVAAYEADAGYADPYLTVNAYAQAARRLGATFYLNTRVIGVRFKSGRVTGVDTSGESLDAPIVLNCTGAWGAQIAQMAGVEAPIDACRIQVAFFRRPPGHEAPHPVVGDFTRASYFRSETGGLTLAGLIDPAEAEAVVDPDRFSQGVDSEFVLDVGERLVGRYPAMEQSRFTGGYASLYAITPDWHPIIDEVPDGSGFYICSGFSGHGFKLGPAVGLMVTDLITKASDPLFDPTLFRFERFAENRLVRGQYEYSIVG